MKLNINNETVFVDFKYEQTTRKLRKGERPKTISKLRSQKHFPTVNVIETTCTIQRPNCEIVTSTVKCDLDNHNKEFARKYSLKKALNQIQDKSIRTDIWKQYFDNLIEELPMHKYQDSVCDFITKIISTDLFIGLKDNSDFMSVTLNKQETQNLIKTLQKQIKYLQ